VILGDQIGENLTNLEAGLWQSTLSQMECLSDSPSREIEVEVADFVDDKFRGFGPKKLLINSSEAVPTSILVLRQAQHKRIILNVTKPPTVHPELVKGRTVGFSTASQTPRLFFPAVAPCRHCYVDSAHSP